MTREEAIKNLEMIGIAFVEPVTIEQRKLINDTFSIAIQALEQKQKSGKWILTIEDWNKWTCSKCGYVKRTDIHVNIGWKYCPNCGSYNGGDNNGNE